MLVSTCVHPMDPVQDGYAFPIVICGACGAIGIVTLRPPTSETDTGTQLGKRLISTTHSQWVRDQLRSMWPRGKWILLCSPDSEWMQLAYQVPTMITSSSGHGCTCSREQLYTSLWMETSTGEQQRFEFEMD